MKKFAKELTMSRPEIAYQEAAGAAIQLQGKDEYPTVDRVREILGTGSKSTIARYLKDWKSKTGHILGSDGIPHELISIIKGLWERLQSESDKQIAQHQQEAEQKIIEIKHSLIEEQKYNKDLQSKIHQTEDALHQTNHCAQVLQQSLEEEKRSNAKFVERNDQLSHQLTDQKLETERLHQLLGHVQANLEHYQAAIQKSREEQILLQEKQKTEHDREINILKQENITLAKGNSELQISLVQLQQKVQLAEDKNYELVDTNSNLKKLLDEKTMSESIFKLKYEQLEKSAINYHAKLEENNKKIIEYEKQLAILTAQLNTLQKTMNESQNTIQILRDEKLFILQEKSNLEGQLKYFQAQLA